MLTSVAHACSDIGRRRSRNEDRHVIDEALQLYVVCDGVGGHSAGDVAAALASSHIRATLQAHAGLFDAVRRGRREPTDVVPLLAEAVRGACKKVWDAAQADSALAGMGCTASAVLCLGPKGVLAHVGDSRIYLIRDDTAHQLSVDHTIATELAAAGVITWDDVPKHPMAHVLTRCVGAQPSVRVDTLVFDLVPDDRLVVCSDGLSDYVPGTAWLAAQLMDAPAGSVPESLVDFANEAGGKDNITVLVVELQPASADATRARQITKDVHTRLDSLAGIFLFEELTLRQLAQVMQAAQVTAHAEGDMVVEAGAAWEALIVVLEGRFELVRGDQVITALGPGADLGAASLLHPRPRRAALRCAAPGRTLTLTRERFDALTTKRPWLGLALLRRLGAHVAKQLDAVASGRTTPGKLG